MTASLKVQETLHKMSGREVAHLVVLALPSSTAAISQTPRPALLPDAWHRPLFHFPHYEPEQSAAPTYTHDLEQIPQFGITECLIQYKCSVHTPPSHAIRSG